MSVESLKELEDFFRSMRQAFNSRDLKTFRSHFWTDNRFMHMDAAGRIDEGWGSYEEVLDQEFRYLDVLKLEFRDLKFQIFDDQFATAVGRWRRNSRRCWRRRPRYSARQNNRRWARREAD